MTNQSPLDLAIAQANNTSQEVASAQAGTPQAVAVVPATPIMSLAQAVKNTVSNDTYLKVKEAGLFTAVAPAEYFESVEVSIDCAKLKSALVIKFGKSNTYLKTFDGVTCSTGGSWQDALAKAASVDPSATPYQSVDLSMTLLEELVSQKGNKILEAGKTLGHSTATTNRQNFAKFYEKVLESEAESAVVKLKVGSEIRTNKDYSWGILTFDFIEIVK